MNKKETSNPRDFRQKNYDTKKMNTSEKPNRKKDKDLPWWVELLFVQIGLPDNLLIKLLKAKKKSRELIKNEKKSLIIFLFLISISAYFYPLIKNAKNIIECEKYAKNYFLKNKDVISVNKREIKMLATNFCYGGEEINKIKNSRN